MGEPSRAARGWDWYLGWLGGGLLLALVIGSFLSTRCEGHIRTAGGALELLGLLSVALGMSRLRQAFDMKAMLAEIADDLAGSMRSCWKWIRINVFRRPPPPQTLTVDSAMAGWGALSVKLTSTLAPGQTVERWLEHLERLAVELQDTVGRLEDALQKEVEERTRAISREREAREIASVDLELRVKDVAVGGLRLEAVGLMWLLGGIALTTWSQELACLAPVRWLFRC